MSATFSVRIPQVLKRKMAENPVDWACEIRCFLEERVKQLEVLKTLNEIGGRVEKRKVTVNSVELIREDRER